LGGAVNLANVDPASALAVETLRLGLRADTVRIDGVRGARGEGPR
jgi:phosphosulfolactate synthase (CoM biosynthesis protein A)